MHQGHQAGCRASN